MINDDAIQTDKDLNYAGLDLNPDIMINILGILIKTNVLEIDTYYAVNYLFKQVNNYFESKGGNPFPPDKRTDNLLTKLSQAKILTQGQKGKYRISKEINDLKEIAKNTIENTEDADYRRKLESANQDIQLLGKGPQSVYVLTYPKYYEKNKDIRLKIGKSLVTCDIVEAVYNRTKLFTFLPEIPKILLGFNCEDCSMLESFFHNLFGLRKKICPDAPGDEWFFASVESIKKAWDFLNLKENNAQDSASELGPEGENDQDQKPAP